MQQGAATREKRAAKGGPGLLFARHGESLWNAAGRWQGQADPPLSPRGREEARELAAALVEERIAHLVSSPLARALETAAIVGEALGLRPRIEPRLRERDAGAWSGLTQAVVARRHPEAFAHFRSGDPHARPGGGESQLELRGRVLEAIADLQVACAADAGGTLIISHLGVLRALAPAARLGNARFLVLETELDDATREIAAAPPSPEPAPL